MNKKPSCPQAFFSGAFPTSSDATGVHRSLRWTIWLGYWSMLAVVTHVPPGRVVHRAPAWADELLHLLCFALLVLLGAWATSRGSLRRLAWWVVCVLAYAAVDEWTQAWVHRTPDVRDWAADAAGALLGALLYGLSMRTDTAPRSSVNPS